MEEEREEGAAGETGQVAKFSALCEIIYAISLVRS